MTKTYKEIKNFNDGMDDEPQDVLEVTDTRKSVAHISKESLEEEKARIEDLLSKFTN